MPEITDTTIIAADGAYTYKPLQSGSIEVSIGNGAADNFEATTIITTIGETELPDLGSTAGPLSAAAIKVVRLRQGEPITITAANTGTAPVITLNIAKGPD